LVTEYLWCFPETLLGIAVEQGDVFS